ncbi:MAG: hypothetical protein JRN15_16260, partial [Nitrososphaerota archaeon]|nr:hypothetical protein [Nitrososphaerota archaeon]
RRVVGMGRSFEQRNENHTTDNYRAPFTATGSRISRHGILKEIYRPPSMRDVVMAIRTDPLASPFIPFALIIRMGIRHSSELYTSNTWAIIESTKKF